LAHMDDSGTAGSKDKKPKQSKKELWDGVGIVKVSKK